MVNIPAPWSIWVWIRYPIVGAGYQWYDFPWGHLHDMFQNPWRLKDHTTLYMGHRWILHHSQWAVRESCESRFSVSSSGRCNISGSWMYQQTNKWIFFTYMICICIYMINKFNSYMYMCIYIYVYMYIYIYIYMTRGFMRCPESWGYPRWSSILDWIFVNDNTIWWFWWFQHGF